jgi:hypothetical protein
LIGNFALGSFFSLKHETFLEEYFKKTTHTVDNGALKKAHPHSIQAARKLK